MHFSIFLRWFEKDWYYLNDWYNLQVKPSDSRLFLLGNFFFWNFWSHISSPCSLLTYSDFLLLHDLVLVICIFLWIYPFLLSPVIWHKCSQHSSLPYGPLYVCSIICGVSSFVYHLLESSHFFLSLVNELSILSLKKNNS